MNDHPWKELLVDRNVHYLMEVDGQLVIVEQVPARVNPETGEKLFSPSSISSSWPPARVARASRALAKFRA